MKKIIYSGLLFLVLNINALCQSDIFFNFDYSVFKSDDEKSILEIYYSVNQNSLKYEQTGNYVFVIYKQNASKTGFDPIGRLKNTEKTYQIQNVNNVYGIKAIYSDGGESKMETTN